MPESTISACKLSLGSAVLTSTQFRELNKHVWMDMFVQLATTLGTELLLTAELLGALRANMQNPPEMKYKISRKCLMKF